MRDAKMWIMVMVAITLLFVGMGWGQQRGRKAANEEAQLAIPANFARGFYNGAWATCVVLLTDTKFCRNYVEAGINLGVHEKYLDAPEIEKPVIEEQMKREPIQPWRKSPAQQNGA